MKSITLPILLFLDGRTVSGILTASENKAELRAANSNAVSIHRSTIRFIRSEEEHLAYERSLNPGLLEYWSGGADIGFAMTSGNSDTTNLSVGLAMTRETRRDKTSIYAASIYNRDSTSGESRTVANTIRGGVRYDRDINGRWFGYGFVDGGEYRINFDSSLVTDITRRIGWQLTLSDRYLSNPPPGSEKNDLLLTTGLKITLGELK